MYHQRPIRRRRSRPTLPTQALTAAALSAIALAMAIGFHLESLLRACGL